MSAEGAGEAAVGRTAVGIQILPPCEEQERDATSSDCTNTFGARLA